MNDSVSFDFRLHSPMVFQILSDLKYLKDRGVTFQLIDGKIYRNGGWDYSPSIIRTYHQAQDVLRDNGCAGTPHFEAICLLEGVSWHKLLDKGRSLLKKLNSG